MELLKSYSELWGYFHRLGSCLAECRECGEKIKIPYKNDLSKLRTHLGNTHRIYPDKWHSKLPEELQKYYTGSKECKATCRQCGAEISYLSKYGNLYQHIYIRCPSRRNQNTIMQSPIIQISNNQNE